MNKEHQPEQAKKRAATKAKRRAQALVDQALPPPSRHPEEDVRAAIALRGREAHNEFKRERLDEVVHRVPRIGKGGAD